MSAADNQLLVEILRGNARAVDELVRGGHANVDGSDLGRPIVVAASHDRVDIINLLAHRGADLNAAHHPPPSSIVFHAPSGATPASHQICSPNGCGALHAAVHAGRCRAIGALLELGADPNCKDDSGLTPLILACRMPEAGYRLQIAKQLLQGGSNPALKCKQGAVALTYAAGLGDVELIKLLAASAPATLNHPQHWMMGHCVTPLTSAVMSNREAAVRALLSLGASDKEVFEREETSALFFAVDMRLEAIVKLLLDEGLEAVGGLRAVASAMCEAVQAGDARTLHLLISVGGEEKRRRWARHVANGVPLLHTAAAFDSLAVVSLLLAAGANESRTNAQGQRPRNMIGGQVPPGMKDEVTEAAIGRVLRRGPAFRARSWAWPTSAAGGVGGGSAATAAVLGGVRIYRPTARLLMSRASRYSNK